MDRMEEVIARAELALCYADRDAVMEALIASGVEPEIAWLAVCAAGVA
ncbi:MAG TPA: hypothetical protein VJ793_09085 [Anaerolineae bacterium]|nr:hypothetical protein [Anaerolineae bacterium]